MPFGSAVQRLAKWRAVFAGWQLGTREKGDPECDAVRDHREVTILLRAEVSALTGLLIQTGVVSAEEFTEALEKEAEMLSADYAKRFPGVEATDEGLRIDPSTVLREGWMKDWKP